MHATIRHYEGAASDELDQTARRVAAKLSGVRGFVLYLVLETEPGALATVSIFEDRDGLEDAERLIAMSFAEHQAALLPECAQVTRGEVVFQKGL